MLNKVNRFAVYTLSILFANYLSEVFFEAIGGIKERTYLNVLFGMLILIIIYVPLFGFLEKYVKKASQTYINKSKGIMGSSKQGLFIGFGIAFLVLFYLYAKQWHNLDLLSDIKGMF